MRNEVRVIRSQRASNSGVACSAVAMREARDHTPVANEDGTCGSRSRA